MTMSGFYDQRGNWIPQAEARPYPAEHISYSEDSQWCQEHGHTGLLAGCPLCERFLASLASPVRVALEREHNPDGSRRRGASGG
jgi:hypothetical protein